MHTAVSTAALRGWQRLAEFSEAQAGRCGASASFVGVMRSDNNGRQVERMFLEHYPGMTERALHDLANAALVEFEVADVLLLHRVGEVRPGDELVVIGVWSAHRAAAFAACEWLIEQLKHRVPLWKKETGPEGSRWVTANTAGRINEKQREHANEC